MVDNSIHLRLLICNVVPYGGANRAIENGPCGGKSIELKLISHSKTVFIGNKNCRKEKIQRISFKVAAKSFSTEV